MPFTLESILLSLALLAAVGAFLAAPIVDRTWLAVGRGARPSRKGQAAGPVSDLEVRHQQIVTALRDLDFDYSLSKLSEDDYRRTRAELVTEGAAVLRALDGVPTSAPRPKAPAAPASDAALEAAIAARRKQKTAAPAAPANDAALEAAIAARRKRKAAPPPPADDALEAAIAARRKSKSAPAARSAGPNGSATCPKCGRAAGPDEAFCPRCGTRLSPQKVAA
jgi:hypothetical protein